MIVSLLAVGVGGFLGGVARWALTLWPGGLRGTFAANLLATAVLGAVIGVVGHGSLLYLALGTGFAGALSTWSTLSRELGQLLKERRYRLLAGYASATLTAGLAMAWLTNALLL
ncbi:FluC/FEX family fluoride channel [Corynebacterium comes]|uniref:Fluoride-specific ion channel FluC n=1 Tax=Corynebacterium comes TaxID=2675218 RepID=A0A6B8W203_9CORY|nr:CrcB family protein [Corynebacterium comes]QGU05445.1 Putative fluoride ion transporter CrcB [Corynebacterium comes]